MSLHDTLMDLFYDETLKMLPAGFNEANLMPLDSPGDTGGVQDNQTDYVFILVSPASSPVNRQIIDESMSESSGGNIVKTVQSCRTFKVEWQIYGEDSSDYADAVRLKLLTDETIKSDLAAQGISVVPDIDEPQFAPESFNQQWYHRYILTADFNQLVTTTQAANTITSAQVEIVTYKGVEGTCSI